uniref:Uncharacterized protein n=1 Tax=Arcella intermedia TaxID=1963864 RepID=A0A6B2L562_9EUKA
MVCKVTQTNTKTPKKNIEKSSKLMDKMLKPDKKKDPPKFIPLEFINRSTSDDSKSVDVGYLQSLPEFRDAVFQVASNFNVVEGMSEFLPPNFKSFTENYYKDRTQGPAASISAGPAAIVRVHAPFYSPDTPPDKWNQDESHQVELLKNLEEYYPVHNGYVLYENGILSEGYKKFPEYQSKGYHKLLVTGFVGFHSSVQVTTGLRYYPNGEKRPKKRSADDEEEDEPDDSLLQIQKDPKQVVHQVFTAATNLNQGRSGPRNKNSPNSATKGKMVLDLGYQGTYLAALAAEKKILVLTLIGGGAFGNEKEWIYQSIVNAHQKWGVAGKSLQKVYLILWDYNEQPKELEQSLKQLGVQVTWKNPRG